MSQVTIVKINGRETAWPLDDNQASICKPNMRTYYLRWNFQKCSSSITSARIYMRLSDLEIQGHIKHLIMFYNRAEKEWCAVFDEKGLTGMAQTCWGVGLLEAQLRGLFSIMPNFELCHPWADYQLVAKGNYVYNLQK